jgi:hypothetical protein
LVFLVCDVFGEISPYKQVFAQASSKSAERENTFQSEFGFSAKCPFVSNISHDKPMEVGGILSPGNEISEKWGHVRDVESGRLGIRVAQGMRASWMEVEE